MKNNSQAFVNQLLVCLLVTIGFGGSIGLGTVWMRHQNSLTAMANRALLSRIEEVKRRNDEITTLIESEKRPELLRQLNTRMALGLVPMNEVPGVHVPDNVVENLAEKANRGMFTDTAVSSAPIVFKVALH